MTPENDRVTGWLVRSCRAQGVDVRVQDAGVVARVVAILYAAPSTRSAGPDATSATVSTPRLDTKRHGRQDRPVAAVDVTP
jgi:hypothetical protein